jgi:hypothetical protein
MSCVELKDARTCVTAGSLGETMARTSLVTKFKDPATRPRIIVWGVVAIFGIAIFAVAVGFIGTSTRYFCGNPGCHKVQGDTMAAYAASSHANISCIACHEPVNATPIEFILAKVKSVGELPPTIANTYELPINKLSAYALSPEEMPSEKCTQCHSPNRLISTSPGIKIDHAVHEKEKITCATCHNRVAHNDAKAGVSLPGNALHADFMKMDACFRCHDLEGKRRAKGDCILCHPVGFELVPDTHREAGWLPKGHSEAANESMKEFGAAEVEAEELVKEGAPEDVAVAVEHCSTCHKDEFCSACHAKLSIGLKLSQKQ